MQITGSTSPDTEKVPGLLCYSGTVDGAPTACLGSRKSCISPPSHCFEGAKSSTLPSQVYSSGWHFRAILHVMSVHSSHDVFPHCQNKDRKKIPPFFMNVNINILLKPLLGPATASASMH